MRFQSIGSCRIIVDFVFHHTTGLIHRIDRPCSGVVVFAKTSKAAARISESFRERKVSKDYLCVVNGYLKGQAC